nr:hypothetical protein [Nanoarchaeum sp.]
MEKQFWETLGAYTEHEGRICLFLPHPLLTQEDIARSIEIFDRTQPSFLMAMDSKGLDTRAIYITSKAHLERHHDLTANSSNSFVYMLDNAQYTTEKQRELAKKYQDNMKDYDQEFLDGKEIT